MTTRWRSALRIAIATVLATGCGSAEAPPRAPHSGTKAAKPLATAPTATAKAPAPPAPSAAPAPKKPKRVASKFMPPGSTVTDAGGKLPKEAEALLNKLRPKADAPTLSRDPDRLRKALGVGRATKTGRAKLAADHDGKLWVVAITAAGDIPLRPVSLSHAHAHACRDFDAGSVDTTYFVEGAPIPMALQLRRRIDVVVVDEKGGCLRLDGKGPNLSDGARRGIALKHARSRSKGSYGSFAGPLLQDGDDAALSLTARDLTLSRDGREVGRFEPGLWMPLTADMITRTRAKRLAGGGASVDWSFRPSSDDHAKPAPLPSLRVGAYSRGAHHLLGVFVLPGNRVLPGHQVTYQSWSKGQLKRPICFEARLKPKRTRCPVRTQTESFRQSEGLYYKHRKGAVLRWTVRSTHRERKANHVAAKCARQQVESKDVFLWHVRATGSTAWIPLSKAIEERNSLAEGPTGPCLLHDT